jgi:cardiolipin synthase A/B
MHVKTVIMDREAILVSSANLTGAAMDRNMELGLLVEGGHLAETVDRHFDELIEAEQVIRVDRIGSPAR